MNIYLHKRHKNEIHAWLEGNNSLLEVSQDDEIETSLALLKKATAHRREAMKPKTHKPKTREIAATTKSNNPNANTIIFVVVIFLFSRDDWLKLMGFLRTVLTMKEHRIRRNTSWLSWSVGLWKKKVLWFKIGNSLDIIWLAEDNGHVMSDPIIKERVNTCLISDLSFGIKNCEDFWFWIFINFDWTKLMVEG